MRKDDGEIRRVEDIPKEQRDTEWSKPFYVGKEVELFGVRMKVKRIKQLRKEIHLVHHTVKIP